MVILFSLKLHLFGTILSYDTYKSQRITHKLLYLIRILKCELDFTIAIERQKRLGHSDEKIFHKITGLRTVKANIWSTGQGTDTHFKVLPQREAVSSMAP